MRNEGKGHIIAATLAAISGIASILFCWLSIAGFGLGVLAIFLGLIGGTSYRKPSHVTINNEVYPLTPQLEAALIGEYGPLAPPDPPGNTAARVGIFCGVAGILLSLVVCVGSLFLTR